MYYYSPIFAFAWISFLVFLALRKTVRTWTSEIGYHKKFYPEKYVKPKRILVRFFKVRQKEIPKFLYIEIFISIFLLLLFPINTIIFLISSKKYALINGILLGANEVYLLINYIIWKKTDK